MRVVLQAMVEAGYLTEDEAPRDAEPAGRRPRDRRRPADRDLFRRLGAAAGARG